MAPQPQAEAHPQEAQPLLQDEQLLQLEQLLQDEQPLSQPQAGSQQDVLQQHFLRLNKRFSKPHFFLQQQVGSQQAGAQLSHPQAGAAQQLLLQDEQPLLQDEQPLSQPQAGSQQDLQDLPQQLLPQQLLQLLQDEQPLSQPQAGSQHDFSQHELLQHLRARRRASSPHFFLQQVSHPQLGVEQQLSHEAAQHPVSQPHEGAAQQFDAWSQHPPPSIRSSKSKPKLCWAQSPMPSTRVHKVLLHFIEPFLPKRWNCLIWRRPPQLMY